MTRPLDGVRVVDFSTLLPGPLATLILAEAGAEVVKIERPGRGDELRDYAPRLGAASVGFALLNRGKRSLALDLKDPAALAQLQPLLAGAQVLVEQFRPGVMDRLGLGYAALRELNPRIVYCSISGYGQSGPKAGVAGHDLNYLADTGLLALGGGPAGPPALPPGLIADIGGGALPAVINILLALRAAAATGQGCHLDVAMTDHLFAWQWWALGLLATGRAPRPGGRAPDRRLAALPGLSHRGRPVPRRGAVGAALLGRLLRPDRAAGGTARRRARPRGDPQRASLGSSHPGPRRTGRSASPGRTAAATWSRASRRPWPICTSAAAACSTPTSSRAASGSPRYPCRSRRRCAARRTFAPPRSSARPTLCWTALEPGDAPGSEPRRRPARLDA